MNKKMMAWGAAFALLSVVLGAFGAHALKEVLTDSQLNSFETGVRYQMYHGLALLLIGFHADKLPKASPLTTFLIIGTILFSGSIYLLNLQGVLGLSLAFLGPITPIGGFCLIIGWSILLISLLKK
jgi:uncharacterized membrane protein YgdD (TMEM256/DUF423 family)|tara:strand:+ start:31 stop:408 length:378 start_codon:yes stop_codon:yes gene_type:complete